ncbi:MAG: hypothetical protein ACYC3X_20610 [Pirellulaceae bacterium]
MMSGQPIEQRYREFRVGPQHLVDQSVLHEPIHRSQVLEHQADFERITSPDAGSDFLNHVVRIQFSDIAVVGHAPLLPTPAIMWTGTPVSVLVEFDGPRR